MTWQSGQPILTAQDEAEWETWKRTRKLEQQRDRRKTYPRIDYYPSEAALEVIRATPGCYSEVIDALVLAGADQLPE